MPNWVFEPGHTAAEFCARHMMVTWVRGSFKNIEGKLRFDPDNPADSSVEVEIDAASLWSGDSDRDDHLRHADFVDAENHPTITFNGDDVAMLSHNDFRVTGALTLRGVTREATLDVRYLGCWDTPFWEDGEDKGPLRRAGFHATTTFDRRDYGVSWNGELDRGGVAVGHEVRVTIDVEALLQD
jgi:polyisoprenoid-binding protein YceI